MLTSFVEVATKPTIAVAICFFFGYAGFRFFRARMKAAPDTTNEQIGGIDTTTGDGWGDYPLDAVFVRTEQRTVGDEFVHFLRRR